MLEHPTEKLIAHFDIPYYQWLSPEGELKADLPPHLTEETILDLYRQILRVRTFDTKAINLQRTGKMGTYPSLLGQEAISVAIGHAMRQDDVLVPYYRDQGAQFQRGVAMADIFQYWGGDERGSDFTANAEDFPICVPIATQCLHATGVAAAFQYRKEARVAVTTIGEGGTSKGDFYEALNLAGAWHLPVVFIVNNNQWAISVPRSAQTHTQTIAQKAIAGGFAGVQVDGNDVIGLREVIGQSIEKARQGGGPTLIEAITYRLGDHTTADDANRYRPKAELEFAWGQEPLVRLRRFLAQKGLWSEEAEKTWLTEYQQEVNQAVETYSAIKPANLSDIFDYTYAECTKPLAEQRQHALAIAKEN